MQTSLGRRAEDDRDNIGMKRLDLNGTLLAGLFRELFKNLTKGLSAYIKACMKGQTKRLNISRGVKTKVINTMT